MLCTYPGIVRRRDARAPMSGVSLNVTGVDMGTRASRRRALPLHKKMSFLALHVTEDIASSFTFNTDALYSIVTLLAGEDARVPMSGVSLNVTGVDMGTRASRP